MLPIHIALIMQRNNAPAPSYTVLIEDYVTGDLLDSTNYAPGATVDVDVYDLPNVGPDYELYTYPDALVRTSSGDPVTYELGEDFPETHIIFTMPSYGVTIRVVNINSPPFA